LLPKKHAAAVLSEKRQYSGYPVSPGTSAEEQSGVVEK